MDMKYLVSMSTVVVLMAAYCYATSLVRKYKNDMHIVDTEDVICKSRVTAESRPTMMELLEFTGKDVKHKKRKSDNSKMKKKKSKKSYYMETDNIILQLKFI